MTICWGWWQKGLGNNGLQKCEDDCMWVFGRKVTGMGGEFVLSFGWVEIDEVSSGV